MEAFQAVLDTIKQEVDVQQFSPFLDQTITSLSKAHIYYCTYKQVQIQNQAAKNPSQGNPAVYGAAVQLIGDHTTIGSYAVTVALVTKCTEDLLNEYRQLKTDHHALKAAYQWHYPTYQPVAWKQGKTTPYVLSPFVYLFSQLHVIKIAKQIIKIVRCALQVFWQSFRISMCLCDAYLMLHGDPRARYEACTELVAQWACYQAQLNQLKDEAQEKLIDKVEQSCDLANHILKRVGTVEDASSVIQKLKATMKDIADQLEEEEEDLYHVAERAEDAVFVKGKIIPLRLNLAEGKAAPPALPRGRFPPWAGQNISLIVPQSPTEPSQIKDDSLLTHLKFPFDAVQGISWLAGQITQLYQNQFPTKKLISPFA